MDMFELVEHIVGSESPLEAQLGLVVRNVYSRGKQGDLVHALDRYIAKKEREIERCCHYFHRDFLGLISHAQSIRKHASDLAGLLSGIQREMAKCTQTASSEGYYLLRHTTDLLIEARKNEKMLVEFVSMLDLGKRAMDERRANRIDRFLITVAELQKACGHGRNGCEFVLEMEKWIERVCLEVETEVMDAVNHWLAEMRTKSGSIGKTSMARLKQMSSMDVLGTDLAEVDIGPLLEAIQFFSAVEKLEVFRQQYFETRKHQMGIVFQMWRFQHGIGQCMSKPVTSVIEEMVDEILGFFVIELRVAYLPQRFYSLRAVEMLWEESVMRFRDILHMEDIGLDNLESLSETKDILRQFIGAVKHLGLSASVFEDLELFLFHRYLDVIRNMVVNNLDKASTKMDDGRLNDRRRYIRDRLNIQEDLSMNVLPWIVEMVECIDRMASFSEGFSYRPNEAKDMMQDTLDRLVRLVEDRENVAGIKEVLNRYIVSKKMTVQIRFR